MKISIFPFCSSCELVIIYILFVHLIQLVISFFTLIIFVVYSSPVSSIVRQLYQKLHISLKGFNFHSDISFLSFFCHVVLNIKCFLLFTFSFISLCSQLERKSFFSRQENNVFIIQATHFGRKVFVVFLCMLDDVGYVVFSITWMSHRDAFSNSWTCCFIFFFVFVFVYFIVCIEKIFNPNEL